jgi:hypothetical protein
VAFRRDVVIVLRAVRVEGAAAVKPALLRETSEVAPEMALPKIVFVDQFHVDAGMTDRQAERREEPREPVARISGVVKPFVQPSVSHPPRLIRDYIISVARVFKGQHTVGASWRTPLPG